MNQFHGIFHFQRVKFKNFMKIFQRNFVKLISHIFFGLDFLKFSGLLTLCITGVDDIAKLQILRTLAIQKNNLLFCLGLSLAFEID